MFSRGKILVQMSLQGTKSDLNSESRNFKITGSEITETEKHVESENILESSDYVYTATKVPVTFENECTSALPQQNVASPPLHQNILTEFTNTDETSSSSNNQIVALEDNLDEYEDPSDSDITLDYDDDVRDPDWKNPDQSASSDTDENNNMLEHVDHEEVVELQRPDPEPSRKRKNGKMKDIQKKKRMCGEKYEGVKKNKQGVKEYCTERAGRFLCPSGCGKKCEKSKGTNCKLLTEEDRGTIFEKFWKVMSWAEKRCYVISHVDRCEVKQRTKGPGESSRRSYSYIYYLRKGGEAVKVCQSMFSSTLGMNMKTIYNWLNESKEDKQGENEIEENESTLVEDERRISARVYLTQLPKVESHYCRSKTKKQYLESVFESKAHLYREYKRKTKSEGKSPYNQTGFFELFDSMNLAIWKPKKDQCDKCVEFEAGNLDREEYERHIKRKDEARQCKAVDKEIAQRDESVKVLTMDLQSLLICPRLEASSLYYKMKLSCHNFTIYDLASNVAQNYFWHEGEGELNANVFASLITDYLEGIDTSKVATVIIYSDGCTYQNRNCTVSNALLLWAAKNDIVVYQKYLERGHTQMECDSVHSVIERKIRKKPIYVPQMYVDNIKLAKTTNPKYKVKYLDHSFFNNYEGLNYYTSIRPGVGVGSSTVTDIRVLRYNTDGKIEYKLDHSDTEFLEIPRARGNRTNEVSVLDVPNKLYKSSIPIKKGKYQHLMQLKSVIPKDVHGFYDNLSHVK